MSTPNLVPPDTGTTLPAEVPGGLSWVTLVVTLGFFLTLDLLILRAVSGSISSHRGTVIESTQSRLKADSTALVLLKLEVEHIQKALAGHEGSDSATQALLQLKLDELKRVTDSLRACR